MTTFWDQKAADRLIPGYMQGGLRRYILEGIQLGSFLTAVLENDLMEAAGRADSVNLTALADYATYLYNYAPQSCHGSPEKVAAWVKKFQDQLEAQ